MSLAVSVLRADEDVHVAPNNVATKSGVGRPELIGFEMRAALARARSEQRIVDAVVAARHAGITWARIRELLGTSALAAQQRCSAVVEPVCEGELGSTRSFESGVPLSVVRRYDRCGARSGDPAWRGVAWWSGGVVFRVGLRQIIQTPAGIAIRATPSELQKSTKPEFGSVATPQSSGRRSGFRRRSIR